MASRRRLQCRLLIEGVAVNRSAYASLPATQANPALTLRFWWQVNAFYCRFWFGLKRIGPCTVPESGPVILASNHTATIDPLLLVAASPRRHPSFLMAVEYYHLPVAWRFFRMIDCVPVDRESADPAAVRSALAHLQAGKVLGIFPEGGVPRPGEVRRARPGVGMLALRSEAAVIPAHISGTRYSPRVAPPFFHRHRARVRFGEPVDLSEFQQMSDRRAAYQAAADRIMQAIRQLAGLAGDAPFRPAGRVGTDDQ